MNMQSVAAGEYSGHSASDGVRYECVCVCVFVCVEMCSSVNYEPLNELYEQQHTVHTVVQNHSRLTTMWIHLLVSVYDTELSFILQLKCIFATHSRIF